MYPLKLWALEKNVRFSFLLIPFLIFLQFILRYLYKYTPTFNSMCLQESKEMEEVVSLETGMHILWLDGSYSSSVNHNSYVTNTFFFFFK